MVSVKNRRIDSLTSMRGIAACLVMVFHLRYAFFEVSSINLSLFSIKIFQKAYLWVDYFFVLSGFVLASRYMEEFTWSFKYIKNFLIHRLARIYPLHLLTLLVFVLYIGIFKGWAYVFENANSINAQLFLIQSWQRHFVEDWNYPSWSLSTEWAAYLLFPVLVAWVKFTSKKIYYSVALILVYFAELYNLLVVYGDGRMDFTHYYGLHRCILQFVIGLTLFTIHRELLINIKSFRIVDFTSALALVSLFLILYFQPLDLWFSVVSVVLVLSLSLSNGWFSKLLTIRPLVFLGEISFSIYLWHAVFGKVFRDSYKALGSPQISTLLALMVFCALLGLVICISYLSHRWIEIGLYRWIRNRFESIT